MKAKILFLSIAILLVPALLAAQQVTYKGSQHYNERVLQFQADSAQIDSSKIVMIGNSLTENGKDWNKHLGMQGDTIVNRGIIGDAAKGIMARLCQILPQKPKAIFLMCGTNDLAGKLTAEQVAERCLKVIKQIRTEAPQTKLYVQSLLPFDEHSRWKKLRGKSKCVPVINKILETYCDSTGITFVNLYPKFVIKGTCTLKKCYSADGLHVNAAGYQLWAEELKPHIQQLQKQ